MLRGGEGQGELSILGIDRAIIILIYVGLLSSSIKVHGLSNLTLKVPTKLFQAQFHTHIL